jgi:tRNA nucleotidyltransferase (CCA-adding enzyme)
MQLNDFTVLRSLPWSEEKSLNVFVFELEQRFLIPLKKHLGPPLERKHECEKFLAKYLSNSDVASGPYIEDGRWVVELRRKYTDVVALLSDTLKNGGRRVGVAELISRKMDKGFKILVNNEIMVTYETNSRFAEFLTEFLSGKPKWLKFA